MAPMATGLLNDRRVQRSGIFALVTLAHVGFFALIAMARPPFVAPVIPPPIEVILIRPPEPPPEPPRVVSAEAGGGAPAAPSRIHSPPEVFDPPDPLPIPPTPEPAPEPSPSPATAPTASPTPGLGQNGQGTGTGSGTGAGSGPGSGAGRATLISGPNRDQIRRAQPRTGLAVRVVGRVEMRCRIRLDGRMEGCSVTREMPPGSRLGQAALSLAPAYRWRPPTDAYGRPQDNTEIIVGLDFAP